MKTKAPKPVATDDPGGARVKKTRRPAPAAKLPGAETEPEVETRRSADRVAQAVRRRVKEPLVPKVIAAAAAALEVAAETKEAVEPAPKDEKVEAAGEAKPDEPVAGAIDAATEEVADEITLEETATEADANATEQPASEAPDEAPATVAPAPRDETRT